MLFLQNMYQICMSDAKFSKEEAAVLFSLRVFYISSLQCYLSPSVFAFTGYKHAGEKINLASEAIDDGVVDIYITTTSCMLCG